MSIEDEIKTELKAQGIIEDKEQHEEIIEEPLNHSGKEYTAFEKEQMDKGWNPDGIKSAEEYARTEPLYEEIKARGKQLKQMQKAIDSLTEHMTKQEKLAYNRALDTLRKEKEEAVLRGDLQTVTQIEHEQARLTTVPESIPEADAFTDKYGHIFKSPGFEEMEIAEFVKQRDIDLMSRKLSPKDHMQALEEHMVKRFPNYFNKKEVVSRDNSSVEMGDGDNVARKSSNRKYSFNDLSYEQKKVAQDFKSRGIMTVEKYIKDLVDLGELK